MCQFFKIQCRVSFVVIQICSIYQEVCTKKNKKNLKILYSSVLMYDDRQTKCFDINVLRMVR